MSSKGCCTKYRELYAAVVKFLTAEQTLRKAKNEDCLNVEQLVENVDSARSQLETLIFSTSVKKFNTPEKK